MKFSLNKKVRTIFLKVKKHCCRELKPDYAIPWGLSLLSGYYTNELQDSRGFKV